MIFSRYEYIIKKRMKEALKEYVLGKVLSSEKGNLMIDDSNTDHRGNNYKIKLYIKAIPMKEINKNFRLSDFNERK